MIQKGSKYWDFNTLLGDHEGEMVLSSSDIAVHSLFRDDYQFSRSVVLEEQTALDRVGLTERIVVERTAEGYSLIGPLLPYLALSEAGITDIPCIVRSGDLPQVQQVLAIRLNAQYSRLSPLVYSRLITRLGRLFPVMKAVSGMNLGIKRDWIANILDISPSAVLRYSYISKVPEPLQQRCADPNFPYLCYKDAISFTDTQFHQLLDELIHYELRSRYIAISSSELSAMIQRIAVQDSTPSYGSENVANTAFVGSADSGSDDSISAPQTTTYHHSTSRSMPALYEPMAETFYLNLRAQYADRYDDDVDAGTASDLFRIAHKDGYMVPDAALQEASYLLYSLSQARLAGGQKLLDYACLRSILDSVNTLYDHIVL